MDISLLKKLGLTESQAKTYIILLEFGNLSPPELAKKTGESRTAAYMALAKLEEIGLASKVESSKKQVYIPKSPSNFDKYLAQKRHEQTKLEEDYRSNLATLLNNFYSKQRQTGVRYFQGEDGLRAMYEDHLNTGEDLYLLRTYADEDFFGDWLYDYMQQRAKRGIKTHSLMPRDERSYQFSLKNDKRLNRKVVWYPPDSYTAPVEISTYGNKVSIISFGDELIGTVLESPQISEAIKQLYKMAEIGARTLLSQD